MQNWKIRIAPSLGDGFSGTPYEAWGLEHQGYCGDTMEYRWHREEPTVFMGLYGFPDFYELWRHKGRKCIFWCGSDILNFIKGYWLEDAGLSKMCPKGMANWINKHCESYVENEIEYLALKFHGIESKIVPSFLGNVDDYKISYQWSEKPKVYTSVSGDDFKLYGWDKLPELAKKNPYIEIHCYGNTKPFEGVYPSNLIFHGRVSHETMNEEIKNMQGCLRLTEFDGFSELVAKALLWGQYPISIINYPHTFRPENMEILHTLTKPNIEGREWLLKVVNKYPWVK